MLLIKGFTEISPKLRLNRAYLELTHARIAREMVANP